MERIKIIQGGITRLEADVIINEIDGGLRDDESIIYRTAGPDLLNELQAAGGCVPGEVRMTKGYRLPARYVIHTVAPVWQGGQQEETELLTSCYAELLQLAQQNGFKSISSPVIGSVDDNFPIELAAEIAIRTVAEFLRQDKTLERFAFVCSDAKMKRAMDNELAKFKPETGQWWDY
ncbi:O-acetyl-ADP-ribose deacetylase (regulator of RNase III), contains Macro domain [Malonomonas rubra DSM 5091]|uniref:O-acetyl-ADP-ribose deacetylase (Regulator of RNase III), contains Macro domain n=1 Tax=Malonomonas rubra DSM 5091 TaxID=1122189 RepID=A0A1M6DPJ1_MALRU|nr:macro domain-containing protein [Malonomonas rubra]SHI75147.1 O-acetyl-ADP-ribose deacetylase (regulator of RNase III), contains Macro domain [Malonomonas rubra DSM 5091]